MVANSSTNIWDRSSEKSCFVSAPITADGVWAIKQLSPRFNVKQTPSLKHFPLPCDIVVAQLGDAS